SRCPFLACFIIALSLHIYAAGMLSVLLDISLDDLSAMHDANLTRTYCSNSDAIELVIEDEPILEACIGDCWEALFPAELVELWSMSIDAPPGPVVKNAMLMSAACLDALPLDRRQYHE